LALCLLGAGLLLAGIPAARAIYRAGLEAQASSYLAAIDNLLAGDKPDQALEVWESAQAETPSLRDLPAMRLARDRIDHSWAVVAARREQFNLHLAAAKKAGTTQPDWKAIDLAWQCAVTDKDKLDIQRWENLARAAAQRRQDQADAAFTQSAGELQELFNLRRPAIARMLKENPAAARDGICELQRRSQPLLDRQDVSSAAMSRAQPMLEDLNRWRRELAVGLFARDADDTGRQTAAGPEYLEDADALASALRAYVQSNPASERAGDFTAAAEASGQWAAVSKALALMREWSLHPPTSTKECDSRLLQIDAFRQEHPASAVDTGLEECSRALSKMRLQCGNGTPADLSSCAKGLPQLRNLLEISQSLAGRGVTLRDADKHRILAWPDNLPGRLRVYAVVSASPATRPAQTSGLGGLCLLPVGLMEGPSVRIDSGRQVVQGSMVFLVREHP
jgi:hypothetical protein